MGSIALAFLGIMIAAAGWIVAAIMWGVSALQLTDPVNPGLLLAMMGVCEGIALVLILAALVYEYVNREK